MDRDYVWLCEHFPTTKTATMLHDNNARREVCPSAEFRVYINFVLGAAPGTDGEYTLFRAMTTRNAIMLNNNSSIKCSVIESNYR